MIATAGSGHPASSLGLADFFVCLYQEALQHDPTAPTWPKRDRFVVSNGHIAPVWYATLAEEGYFPVEELLTLRKFHSRLQGHPVRGSLPGVENSSGSLGQGLAYASGLALSAKLKKEAHHVYCLMGDGEQQEGSVWESYWFVGHNKLTNLTAIIDLNGIQSEDRVEDVLSMKDFEKRLSALGWKTIEVDGHNHSAIIKALDMARSPLHSVAILLKTIPGKGVSFMENNKTWHAKAPSSEEKELALKELEALDALDGSAELEGGK